MQPSMKIQTQNITDILSIDNFVFFIIIEIDQFTQNDEYQFFSTCIDKRS